jgi:UDP-glucose 4-epimerase
VIERVLITGGAGFIGSAVARSMAQTGASITIVDDLSTGSAAHIPSTSRLITHDVSDPSVVAVVASERPDLVIHAAAQVSVTRSIADPERDHAINVVGTRNILAGALAAGSRRLVFISSGGAIYGDADGATEEWPPHPESPYGRNKLLAVEIVASSGISHAIGRLANVYGPGQRADLEGGVVAVFMEAALAGRDVSIFGDGDQARDFVHVDDVVAAVGTLSAPGSSGTWNVASGVATSIHALLEQIERTLGRRVPHTHLPARAGEVYRSRLAIERIIAETDWRPRVSVADGLAALAARTSAR